MPLVVGVDFDNTIIDYGDLFFRAAVAEGLCSDSAQVQQPGVVAKADVRQQVRALTDGEEKWQLVQSIVYSQELVHARLFAGVAEFLRLCQQHELVVYVISHKTEVPVSPAVPAVNLRQAALDWLERQGVLEPAIGFLIPRQHVFFHATRQKKLASIRRQQCDYFVDDLPEVLADPGFPASTERILFSPHREGAPPEMTTCASWHEISRVIFPES